MFAALHVQGALTTLTGSTVDAGALWAGQDGIDGLGGVRALAESPDGAHVYAASRNSTAPAALERVEGGALEPLPPASGAPETLAGLYDVAVPDPGTALAIDENQALQVYLREAATGRLVWTQTAAGPVGHLTGAASLTARDDVAWTTAAGTDNIAVWTKTDAGWAFSASAGGITDPIPVLDAPTDIAYQDILYAASPDNGIVLLDVDDGGAPTPRSLTTAQGATSLATTADHVAAVARDLGVLYVFDRAPNGDLTEFYVGAPPSLPTAVAWTGPQLYVGTTDGVLVYLPDTTAPLMNAPLAAEVTSLLVSADGHTVYAAAHSADRVTTFVRLGAESGEPDGCGDTCP